MMEFLQTQILGVVVKNLTENNPARAIKPGTETIKDRKHFDYYKTYCSDPVRRLDPCHFTGVIFCSGRSALTLPMG
jgi:hypothetical protein